MNGVAPVSPKATQIFKVCVYLCGLKIMLLLCIDVVGDFSPMFNSWLRIEINHL